MNRGIVAQVVVWRLALGSWRTVDGEGARLYGGRWNSPGTAMVYAATHISLALLEQLVHVSAWLLPERMRAFAVTLPDDAVIEQAAPDEATDDVEATRRAGDLWAASLRSAALIVPSVIVPARLDPGGIRTTERNVLLNPRHSTAARWGLTETSFRLDPRLRREA
ncbi:MAG: RES family NAD+ phosphorylase, partial [Acetobacteraceae bacterium]